MILLRKNARIFLYQVIKKLLFNLLFFFVALNLLKSLLEATPEKRPSAFEALNHEFFKIDSNNSPHNVAIDLSDLSSNIISNNTLNSSFSSFVFKKAIYNGKIENIENSENSIPSPLKSSKKNFSKFSNNFCENTENNIDSTRLSALNKRTSIKMNMHKTVVLKSTFKNKPENIINGKKSDRRNKKGSFEEERKKN